MTGPPSESLDEIDGHILRILSLDPRAPYSDIADELKEVGYDMSSEGIRYRVRKLMKATRPFFLLDPEDLDWKIVRIAVTAAGHEGAKDEAFERIVDMPFWHVTRGLGSYDIFAIGMARTVSEIDEYVTTITEMECVETAGYIVVTDRASNLDNYYRTSE